MSSSQSSRSIVLSQSSSSSSTCQPNMPYNVAVNTDATFYMPNHQPVNITSPIMQTPSMGNFNFQLPPQQMSFPSSPQMASLPQMSFHSLPQMSFHLLPQMSFHSLPHNRNPFILKFVIGNIRICQSCRSSLREVNGTVHFPPYDLCVLRLERRPYWHEASKSWCSPAKESNAHYCAKLSCLQASKQSKFCWEILVDSFRDCSKVEYCPHELFDRRVLFGLLTCDMVNIVVASHFAITTVLYRTLTQHVFIYNLHSM